ncbi:hypothetical protein ACI6Q2_23090 [Chitinophagaceae bacterium LWZ2-11]
MKKLLVFTVVAVLGSCSMLMAQQGNRGGGVERQVQMYKDSLNLTAPQADSVKSILETFQPQQREIMMDQSMDRDAKMAKMKDLATQRNARLSKVLSADQIKKMQDMEERQRQQRMQRQGGGGGGK